MSSFVDRADSPHPVRKAHSFPTPDATSSPTSRRPRIAKATSPRMPLLGKAAQRRKRSIADWRLCQLQNSGEMKPFLKNGSWSLPAWLKNSNLMTRDQVMPCQRSHNRDSLPVRITTSVNLPPVLGTQPAPPASRTARSNLARCCEPLSGKSLCRKSCCFHLENAGLGWCSLMLCFSVLRCVMLVCILSKCVRMSKSRKMLRHNRHITPLLIGLPNAPR